jgi:ABC-2 type transport system ATP-binding protein
VWESIKALVAAGTTVLLTTQYLEEADQLADQISLIDRGRVIAAGSPDRLKAVIGGDRVDVVLHDADDLPAAAALIGRVAGGEVELDRDSRRVSVPVRNRMAALTELVPALSEAGIAAEDLALRRPSLDEVFLRLTGHRADKTEEAGQEVAA